MKKQMFRISLTENANGACNDLVLAAAKSNGSTNKVTLEQLQFLYNNEQSKYPTLTANSTAELIGGNLLHIDRKVGDTYETVCIIEEIEIVELATRDNVCLQQYGVSADTDINILN